VTVFYCPVEDQLFIVGVHGALGFNVFTEDKKHKALYDFDMSYWVYIGDF
jgi:hypothetical protein